MSRASKPVIESIIRGALRELADADYQQRVWVTGSATEVSSMNEAAAALFNDSGLDEALERNNVTFSPSVDTELRELRGMLHSCLSAQARRGTVAVITSPDWSGLRNKAARILDSLAAES